MAVRRAAPSAITNTVRRSAPLPGAGTPFSGMRVAVAAQTGNNNPMLFSATKAARGANGPGNRATSARSPAAPFSGAAIWHRPTPELVWPKQAGMQAADAREPYKLAGHAGGPGIDSGTSRQATSAARAAQAAPPAGAIAAQLRDGPLDAVLADRLATEVIRRVERSMRIERERRGY